MLFLTASVREKTIRRCTTISALYCFDPNLDVYCSLACGVSVFCVSCLIFPENAQFTARMRECLPTKIPALTLLRGGCR